MKKFVFLSAVIGILFSLTISMGATAFAYTWHHTASHAVIHDSKLEDRNSSGTLIDTYWTTITVQ